MIRIQGHYNELVSSIPELNHITIEINAFAGKPCVEIE